jgi:hypothetical protein
MQQTVDVTRLVDSKLAAQQTATLNKLYQRYVGMGGQQMQN